MRLDIALMDGGGAIESFSTISSASANPAATSPTSNVATLAMFDGLVGGGSTPRVIMSSNSSGASSAMASSTSMTCGSTS
jgi:hypothetical protein